LSHRKDIIDIICQGHTKFSENLGAISNFQIPESWHEANLNWGPANTWLLPAKFMRPGDHPGFVHPLLCCQGARGGAVGWSIAIQAGRSRARFPMASLEILIDINLTTKLGGSQPLTEMNTRNISWGKGSRCIGLTNLQLSCGDCLEIWEPQPPGTLWACPDLYRDNFTSYYAISSSDFIASNVRMTSK
jgi:hypothetical protein